MASERFGGIEGEAGPFVASARSSRDSAVSASAGVAAPGRCPAFHSFASRRSAGSSDSGRGRANVELAEAIQREALVNYERVVYTAFRDVADARCVVAATSEDPHRRVEQDAALVEGC